MRTLQRTTTHSNTATHTISTGSPPLWSVCTFVHPHLNTQIKTFSPSLSFVRSHLLSFHRILLSSSLCLSLAHFPSRFYSRSVSLPLSHSLTNIHSLPCKNSYSLANRHRHRHRNRNRHTHKQSFSRSLFRALSLAPSLPCFFSVLLTRSKHS